MLERYLIVQEINVPQIGCPLPQLVSIMPVRPICGAPRLTSFFVTSNSQTPSRHDANIKKLHPFAGIPAFVVSLVLPRTFTMLVEREGTPGTREMSRVPAQAQLDVQLPASAPHVRGALRRGASRDSRAQLYAKDPGADPLTLDEF